MQRVIVSAHTGGLWNDIARVTWPTMKSYSDRHGAVFVGKTVTTKGRPASWRKLVCIAEALVESDEVLWLDADVSVVDESLSLFEDVPEPAIHAASLLTDEGGKRHHNMGVWLLRRGMLPYLVEAAMDDEAVFHPWWEQHAINKLIGSGQITTHTLGEEWNFWTGSPASVLPRFRHACGIRDHADRLRFLLP